MMVVLSVNPYKSKVDLEKWHVGRRCFFSRRLFRSGDLGNVWIWTSFWSLNLSYNITHSYTVITYLLLCWTAYSSVFIFHQFLPRGKECSVSGNGSFVCGDISVLCSWGEKIFFLPFLSAHCSWQWPFFAGNWSSCVILGHVCIMPLCHSIGIVLDFLIYFSSTLSPHHAPPSLFSSKKIGVPICVPFSELSPPWLSLLLSIATASFSNQLHSESLKTVLFCFLYQKTCLTLSIKIRLFGENFTERWDLFQFVSKYLTLIVVCYDFCTFLGCHFWAVSQLLLLYNLVS